MRNWSSEAAIRGVRAAVVMPGLFAFALKVIGNTQIATFTAFGSFATLVLAGFTGSRRDKLFAHAGLAVTGSVLLTIGTAVNSSAALGALVTVPVAFAVFFAGIAGPNAASGAIAALLAYVLPAASPGTISMVPDRLAGWWLASVVGTAAVLAFSGRSPAAAVRGAASKTARLLADEIDAALDGSATDDAIAATVAAKEQLLERFTSTPFKPTGLAAHDEALANAVELLEWCTVMLGDALRERIDLRGAAAADRELLEASAAVLRDAAVLFDGGVASPDLERIEAARRRSLEWLAEQTPEGPAYRAAAQLSFHANAISLPVLTVASDALLVAGVADETWYAEQRRRLFAAATGGLVSGAWAPRRASRLAAAARREASLRSIWLVNSLRGAIALAAAVAIADLTTVQHGFWVVLGTLSVLRTSAAATGATAVRALGGTALGFAIGGLLLVAIGANSAALWAVLPVAVLVAAYSPGTLPFAVGQAGFTVTIAVLFNLLVPVGWSVGVIRVEDVAIGCAVSVLVGSVLWPHGVSTLVAEDLADAFRTGASYLGQAVSWASGPRVDDPDGAMRSVDAGLRLSDALRGFLTEQGTKHISKRELWRLVGGSMRLRLTANLVASLPRDAVGDDAARGIIHRRTDTLMVWYERFAEVLAGPRDAPPMQLTAPQFDPADVVQEPSGSHYGVWLCEDLDHLSEHLGDLVAPAERIAEIRRSPWWR